LKNVDFFINYFSKNGDFLLIIFRKMEIFYRILIPGCNEPLGQVRIGPNHSLDNHHWENMVKNHGDVVKMGHALREI
jgi:hypothetical protein